MANLGSGLSGAASGATLGTAVLPGIGTAIGAIGGGLIGLFSGGGDDEDPVTPAPVVSSYTSADAQAANAQSQLSAQQQQAFLQQLAAQNGAQNQSAVFHQLQGVAAGQGPNPAQAMLANQTGANVAQQAALMAGQRGAGANAGLIARQAAMQGANTQQQSIGQGAALQAQQSLGAMGQLSGIAQNQVANQQAAAANLGAQNQGIQGMINNSIAGVNTATVAAQTPLNQIKQQSANDAQGGLLSGLGAAATVFGGSSGGSGGYGGYVNSSTGSPINPAQPSSATNPYAHGGMVTMPTGQGPQSIIGRHQAGGFHMPTMMAQGGQVAPGRPVPALVSPGEKILSKADAQAVAAGSKDPMTAPTVPGKAMVKGNSLKNDTVETTLEEGGCVIPRSILEGKNPHEAAAKFVAAHMKAKGKK